MELVAVAYGISFFTDFIIVSACSLICLRAAYQVSGAVCLDVLSSCFSPSFHVL